MSTLTRRTALTAGWTVRAVGGSRFESAPVNVAGRPLPATVPGCVHTDLLAANVIPDPYLDDNEAQLGWIGRTDWRYETTFDRPETDAHTKVELVCAGLDTVARIEVNGTDLASTRNMHRGYRFDVTDRLRPGDNTVAITFTSALDHAEAVRDQLGARPHVNTHPFNMIRKMAANFGWDWGPALVTAGIWRPIGLHEWHTARLGDVRPLVTLTGTAGRVDTHVGIARDTDEPLAITVEVGDHRSRTTTVADEAIVTVDVPTPDLWWPRGHGAQPLYPIRVELSTQDGRLLDRWTGRIGFRTVELNTAPDESGTQFQFIVNGVPVLAKGANWIPDDCFPHRVDRDRYATRFGAAIDAGVNLLRVWGGGIYESDDFYDLADELGLLVWQDFLFACAAYPEEEPLRGEVIAEAREAVTRLAPHPSLALWNGCNENIWGYHDWDWQEALGERTWGIGYYTDVLPKIVAELDPTRPYCPGSPWSFATDIHPNDPDHGCTHVWDVWNQLDYTEYRNTAPRFVAEFGWCGPPTMSTLHRAIHHEPPAADSPAMLAHLKADDGQEKLTRGINAHFPPQQEFADWHWAAQLTQARAVATGIQHYRSHTPHCAGTIIWQLNDCWPVTSWAMIDGDGRRKPAWYALRDSYADRLLTIQPRDHGLALIAVNDTATTWWQHYEILRVDFDGTMRVSVRGTVEATARGAATLPLPSVLSTPQNAGTELLIVLTGANTTTAPPVWFFADDRDQRLPPPELTTHVTAMDDGYHVLVWAGTLLRDLTLLTDQVAEDAVVDRALVTVLPGTSTTFHVRTRTRLDPALLTAPTVLRCANQLTATDWSSTA